MSDAPAAEAARREPVRLIPPRSDRLQICLTPTEKAQLVEQARRAGYETIRRGEPAPDQGQAPARVLARAHRRPRQRRQRRRALRPARWQASSCVPRSAPTRWLTGGHRPPLSPLSPWRGETRRDGDEWTTTP